MSGTAADLFFWNDWQGDPCLRLCSLAAQGLWMRLLCIAAESSKRGFVLINGQKPSVGQLARVTGCGPAELQKLGQELEANGVYSRDGAGVIYCRRMVRQEKKRRASAKGGKIGGRSTLSKQRGIFATQDATQGGTQPPIPKPVTDTDTDTTKNASLRSAAATLKARGGIEIPDWLPSEPWEAFVAMRRKKGQRTPFTIEAAVLIVGKLDAMRADGEDVTAMLHQTIMEGWTGVFPVKEDRGKGGGRASLFQEPPAKRILSVIEGGQK